MAKKEVMAEEGEELSDITYTHNGTCFVPESPVVVDLLKGTKDELTIRNESDQVLTLVYVVDTATRKDHVAVEIGKVKPFHQREIPIPARSTGSFFVKPNMGVGSRGDVSGSLHPHGGCSHQSEAILSHTEWHIEC